VNVEEYIIEIEAPSIRPIKIKLIRIKAPLTIQALIKKLPLTTRISKFGKQVIINIPIKTIVEKTSREVKKGEVAYWHASQAMVIYLEDMKLMSPVVIIGEVIKGLEILNEIRSGLGVQIRRVS